ncbi:MAG: hypothetical protein ABFR97_06770 [Thermodesulfobacteriota bacterium]
MTEVNDIWDQLGSVSEEEAPHVLSKLFMAFEARLERQGDDTCAQLFMEQLALAIRQTQECNLNRR